MFFIVLVRVTVVLVTTQLCQLNRREHLYREIFFNSLILLVAILTCVFTWLDAVGGAMGCGSVGAHKICPGVGVYAGLKEVV